MRLMVFAAIATVAAFAQDTPSDAPSGIVRGDLLKWTGTPTSGQILLTNPNGEYRCGFDAKTYIERDGQRVAIGAFSPGDRIEILADRKTGSQACYARTLHAVEQMPVRTVPGRRPPLVRGPSPTETWAPRGDLTFSGRVVRVTDTLMVLRTRTEPTQEILLRQDTRYLAGGVRVEATTLKVNTHVFVRGGRNLDNEIEAYQVIWGDIVQPAP